VGLGCANGLRVCRGNTEQIFGSRLNQPKVDGENRPGGLGPSISGRQGIHGICPGLGKLGLGQDTSAPDTPGPPSLYWPFQGTPRLMNNAAANPDGTCILPGSQAILFYRRRNAGDIARSVAPNPVLFIGRTSAFGPASAGGAAALPQFDRELPAVVLWRGLCTCQGGWAWGRAAANFQTLGCEANSG